MQEAQLGFSSAFDWQLVKRIQVPVRLMFRVSTGMEKSWNVKRMTQSHGTESSFMEFNKLSISLDNMLVTTKPNAKS